MLVLLKSFHLATGQTEIAEPDASSLNSFALMYILSAFEGRNSTQGFGHEISLMKILALSWNLPQFFSDKVDWIKIFLNLKLIKVYALSDLFVYKTFFIRKQ